jgi:hypothetical protein
MGTGNRRQKAKGRSMAYVTLVYQEFRKKKELIFLPCSPAPLLPRLLSMLWSEF